MTEIVTVKYRQLCKKCETQILSFDKHMDKAVFMALTVEEPEEFWTESKADKTIYHQVGMTVKCRIC